MMVAYNRHLVNHYGCRERGVALGGEHKRCHFGGKKAAISRLMWKGATRAALVLNLRGLRGLAKRGVR
jgi:hypothetical protein